MPPANDKPFFRQEVLEARRQSWLGTISLAQPMRWPLMAGLALCLACAVLGVLAFGSYSPKLRIAGQLVARAEGSSGIQAEFSIPARVAGAIAAGDPIVVHLHESAEGGRVDLPGRVAAVVHGTTDGKWQVLVDLDATHLVPGMGVDAVVRGERRSLYKWAFAPLAPDQPSQ